MRCVIHDYAGHPFQVGLSRDLARHGHEVHHIYFADNPGPKGIFEHSDNTSLHFMGIRLGIKKHQAGTGALSLGRRWNDVQYGRAVAEAIRKLKPDVVLSGNTPTEAQKVILNTCKADNIRFVYWVQDIYSVAVSKILAKKLPVVGDAIGWYYRHLDRRQFRKSDAIVAISEDFLPLITAWAPATQATIIENWAAIDDLPLRPKNNDWAREHGLETDFVYMYSGTLGRKHNPSLLLQLAMECRSNQRERVVAVAQGYGVPMLQEANNKNLTVLPLQPAQRLADVLATADVLLATIEPDAGTFAVPSKVLTYLCTGRPILLAAPSDNLAARIVQRANAGFVVKPHDVESFVWHARCLLHDVALRTEMGANGRAYAERAFDLPQITERFQRVLCAA